MQRGPDGWLVFTGVKNLCFQPAGPLPNDLINGISMKVDLSTAQGACVFELSISSIDESGRLTEVLIRIEAHGVHLEDPAKPGIEIIE